MVLPCFAFQFFNEWQVLPRAAETARMLGLDVLWAPGSLHARKPIRQWPLICWSGWISCLIPASTYLETRIDCRSWKGTKKKPSVYQGVSHSGWVFCPEDLNTAWRDCSLDEDADLAGWHFCTSQVCAWFCIVSDQKFDFWGVRRELSINQNSYFSMSLYQNESWAKERRKHQPAMSSLRLTRAAHHDQMLLLSPSRAQASLVFRRESELVRCQWSKPPLWLFIRNLWYSKNGVLRVLEEVYETLIAYNLYGVLSNPVSLRMFLMWISSDASPGGQPTRSWVHPFGDGVGYPQHMKLVETLWKLLKKTCQIKQVLLKLQVEM